MNKRHLKIYAIYNMLGMLLGIPVLYFLYRGLNLSNWKEIFVISMIILGITFLNFKYLKLLDHTKENANFSHFVIPFLSLNLVTQPNKYFTPEGTKKFKAYQWLQFITFAVIFGLTVIVIDLI